ncbi:MAG: dNTP triphosphohydrolase [Burkholderiales bacterium]|nr:dNTP triphosphohydrolase [Burkholderiales bacterium]
MEWNKLLSAEKKQTTAIIVNAAHNRTRFERDINKIIFSPFFRQLQNKTQLFPIPNGDFIHSRLTHSLEVSSVGMSLGTILAEKIKQQEQDKNGFNSSFMRDIPNIVGAACLLHDIGNPPFGHSGEDSISSFFQNNYIKLNSVIDAEIIKQLANFNGNAQTVRLIAQSNGLNLTLATIAATLKYPTMHNNHGIYGGKYSIFSTELNLFDKIADKCGLIPIDNANCFSRHPLAFLVEAADDVCYRLLDLEDAYTLKLICYEEIENYFLQVLQSQDKDVKVVQGYIKELHQDDKFARLRSYTLNVLIDEVVAQFLKYYGEIMSGNYDKLIINGTLCGLMDMIILDDTELSNTLKKMAVSVENKAYKYNPVIEIELAGHEILDYLLNEFVFSSLGLLTSSKHKSNKLLQLLPEKYKNSQDKNQQIMLITDYIASQSDKYALELYRKLKGIELPEIRLF